MRSIKNRLLLKGRKNKQTIITILLALAIVVGTSNALDFCIDHKDVAIAVNKNIAGNGYNAAAIHQVVDFVNGIVGYVGVVFVTAGAGDAKVEYLHHRNPIASGFGHLLSHALLPLKGCYMCLASSRLCFM